ncbi:MAG TPA: hypothetical protein VK590_07160 [Saprospiraceae bacterium]|nr:hypothetical protein [Saprospiraceae bacterium]
MVQLFKDWGDYIVGIPAIVISVILTIYFYSRQKKYKKLAYETIVNYKLFEVVPNIKDKIIITYDGKITTNLRLISIKIINIGRLPLLKTDFDKDIHILFDKMATLIDVDIIKKNPENLDIIIEVNNNQISIKPLLLNPNEYFIVKTILDSSITDFDILCRIADISEIIKISSKQKDFQRRGKIVLVVMIYTLFVNYLCYVEIPRFFNTINPFLLTIILIIPFIFYLEKKDPFSKE